MGKWVQCNFPPGVEGIGRRGRQGAASKVVHKKTKREVSGTGGGFYRVEEIAILVRGLRQDEDEGDQEESYKGEDPGGPGRASGSRADDRPCGGEKRKGKGGR